MPSKTSVQKTPSTKSDGGNSTTKKRSHHRAAAIIQQQAMGNVTGGVTEIPSHPFLPPALLSKAYTLFHSYCAEDENPPVDGTMSVGTLQQFLTDMAVPMSENQVKDLIFSLRQSAVFDRTAEGDSELPTARTQVTDVSEGPGSDMTLPFELFVQLLTMTMSDCERDKELAQVWKQLDADKDGNLSVKDVQTAVQKYSVVDDPISDMTAEEIADMLVEMDLDNDKRVSFDDFNQALTTS